MRKVSGDMQKGARAQNRRRVLELLRQHKALNLAEISQLLALSRATVSSLAAELVASDLVREVGTDKSTSAAHIGRPSRVIALNDSGGGIVGVEFEQSYIRVAVANLDLQMLVEPELKAMDVWEDARAALEAAATMVKTLLAKARLPRSRVIGAGISVPAPIRRDPIYPQQSTVESTTILSDWVGRRPAEELESLLQLPVLIENDANLSALAEVASGAATGCAQVLYVKASTGVGCGLIMDGRLYRGAVGTAGELAHVVVAPQGSICYCGNRGCLQTVVGAGAITRDLLSSDVGPVFSPPSPSRRGGGYDEHLAQVIKEAQAGERTCQTALRDAAEALGVTVAGICNVLNPERVVIGGVLSTAGDLVFSPLTAAAQRYTSPLFGEPVRIVRGHLQEEAELRGALALVRWESSSEITDRLEHLLQELSRPARRPHTALGKRSTAHTEVPGAH